ncbi:MAG: hypothetical protein JOZ72_02135 [Alphaproteobacteria bacterium]|nr:hypothetical protein [Alphaproteobacteria bacterium]
MRKLILATLGLLAFAALWKKEAEEDGTGVALSPFIGALAVEFAVFLLSRPRISR